MLNVIRWGYRSMCTSSTVYTNPPSRECVVYSAFLSMLEGMCGSVMISYPIQCPDFKFTACHLLAGTQIRLQHWGGIIWNLGQFSGVSKHWRG